MVFPTVQPPTTEESSGGSSFTDMLGSLGSFLSQPSVLLPGVVGGLLTDEASGRLSDIGNRLEQGLKTLLHSRCNRHSLDLLL